MDVIALAVIFTAVLWLQIFLFSRFAFRKLDYMCEFSVSEAYEGDSIFLIETVYNGKLLPVPWLRADIHTSRWLGFAETCSVVAQNSRWVTSSFVLKSYQKTTRRWKLTCLKRGIFFTENVTLVTGDLLNYGVNSIAAPVHANLVVYPQTIDIDDLFVAVNPLQGDRIVKRWIIDDPFIVSGPKDYTPGDPPNRIHWPATARCGKLMVKKNEFTSQQSLTVLLNMQSRLYENSFVVNTQEAEFGIKVAATIFDRAFKEGIPVRFATNGCISSDARQAIFTGEAADKDHFSALYRILAGLLMKNVKDFETLLDEVIPVVENTEIIIVTAYLSKMICRQSDFLAASGNTVSIVLLDTACEAGARPENAGLYILSDKKCMQLKGEAEAT